MNIRFRRKPRGVKLVTKDGQEIPCSLVRRPDKDAGGIEKWELMPTQGLFSTDFPVHLAVKKLPPKTGVFVEGTVPMPVEERPPETYIP